MKRFFLLSMLLFTLIGVAGAKESIPTFKTVTKGVEFRKVLLDLPRPLTVYQLRCDPRLVKFHLLLASDGKRGKTATGPGTVLMSAPLPQTRWYSDRRTVGFPEKEADFAAKLNEVNFVLVVNYERGQPEYVARLVSTLFPEPAQESKKYLLFIDRFGQATFMTSAEEFRLRLHNSGS